MWSLVAGHYKIVVEMKTKFFKNLYSTISYLGVTLIFTITGLGAFWEALSHGSKYAWILLTISIGIVILYFLFGYYWIFKKVQFDETGIEITIHKKVLRIVKWTDIKEIERVGHNRNPALEITVNGGKTLYLDDRKKIRKAISEIGGKLIISYGQPVKF